MGARDVTELETLLGRPVTETDKSNYIDPATGKIRGGLYDRLEQNPPG